jgi:hypothetical protein
MCLWPKKGKVAKKVPKYLRHKIFKCPPDSLFLSKARNLELLRKAKKE